MSQALTGQISTQAPAEQEVDEGGALCTPKRRRLRKQLTLDQALKNVFLGIAFLLITLALAFSRVGQGWWFWMLLPAFSLMGTGVAQYIRIRESQKRAQLAPPPVQRTFAGPARNYDELRAPVPSVTEGTTRHLGVESPTRHLDATERR